MTRIPEKAYETNFQIDLVSHLKGCTYRPYDIAGEDSKVQSYGVLL